MKTNSVQTFARNWHRFICVYLSLLQSNAITCTCSSYDRRWVVTADTGPNSMVIVWDSHSGYVCAHFTVHLIFKKINSSLQLANSAVVYLVYGSGLGSCNSVKTITSCIITNEKIKVMLSRKRCRALLKIIIRNKLVNVSQNYGRIEMSSAGV